MLTIWKPVGLIAALGLAVLGGGVAWNVAQAQSHAKAPSAPTGKITPWAAIKLAQSKVPGRPLQANFEFDEGKWVYGVMIVTGRTIKEVEIDPTSGKIGDVETVTPDAEAKEIKDELTKAIGGKVTNAPTEKGEADEKNEKGEKPE